MRISVERGRLFASLLALVLAACGGGGGSAGRIEQAVALGMVPAGAVTTINVVVANPLDAAATVSEMQVPGGTFFPMPGSLPAPVPAGGQLTLPVAVSPAAQGLQEGEIRLRFAAGGEEREVALLCKADVERPTLTLFTPTLAFPDTTFGQQRTVQALVRNESTLSSVTVTSVKSLPAEFSSSLAPKKLLPGDDLLIPITYAPTVRGSHDFMCKIASDVATSLNVHVTAQTATWPAEQIIDFGLVPIVDGKSDWLEVDVSPDAISLSLEAIGGVVPGDFQGPGGRVYLEDRSGPLWWADTGWYAGVVSVMLPQGDPPDIQLVPGGGIYRFRLYSHMTGGQPGGPAYNVPVRAIVHNRTASIVNGGILDLNIFVTPGLGITNPATDTKLQSVIARITFILAQVGLKIGSVSYYTLANAAYDAIEDPDIEMQQLLQESKVAAETRMNVFFVLDIVMGKYYGLSPFVAGVKRNGTNGSGVLADYDFGSAAEVGQVAAHEIGHYLGLWHIQGDRIDDTPECPSMGTDSICTTWGGGQLMHMWWAGTTALPILTPGQGNIILRHPLVAPDPLASLAALAQTAAPQAVFVQLPPGFCGTCAKPK